MKFEYNCEAGRVAYKPGAYTLRFKGRKYLLEEPLRVDDEPVCYVFWNEYSNGLSLSYSDEVEFTPPYYIVRGKAYRNQGNTMW